MTGRSGELTRGMLVVDRRDDVGNYRPGDNRAQAWALNPATDDPRAVQLRKRVEAEGVIVVTDSPGPQQLMRLMFERIWGVTGWNM
jgi:hypothetical protein